MATGYGARVVGKIGGGEAHVGSYYVPSTDSTALLVGDFVELVNAMDPKGEVPVVTRATAGNVLLGVVVACNKPDASSPYENGRAASTNRYVAICDDPAAIFEIQEDAVGGAVSAAAVGENQNADIIVASGALGISGTMLDSSTAAVTSANLKIIGVRRDGVNAAAATAGAQLLVRIHEHALTTTDSRS